MAGAETEHDGWWVRNWAWFVPVGCLTIAFLVVAGAGMLIWLAVSSSRSIDLFEEALAAARSDPRVIEALGEPVEMGWTISGSLRYENDDGEADLTIPISGPDGTGQLRVEAVKQGGDWIYHRLEVTIDATSEIIDLTPGVMCLLRSGGGAPSGRC